MKVPSEAFQKIRRLQIKALRNVDDLFAGIYRSAFKGRGLEFEEVREYQAGDDIRTIDWNVTARSQHPFVKHFREERELTVILMVDISASCQFSHTHQLKSEMMAELSALLAFSAIKNQDKVGLILFTNEIELYLKPKKGLRHVLRVIRELLYFKPKHRGTDLPKALSFLGKVQRKHAIVFLFSDFLTDNFSSQMKIIAKRHEMIAFHIFDAYENKFIPQGLFALKDLETHEIAFIDTADINVQDHYEHIAKEKEKTIKLLFQRNGIDYFLAHTGELSSDVLYRYFNLREGK